VARAGGMESWEAGLGTPGWWARILLFGTALGAVVGLIGFVSGDLLICLFNWTAMVAVGTAMAAWLVPALARGGRRIGLAPPFAVAGAAILAAAPIALFAGLFSAWAWPAEVGRMSAFDWYARTLLVEALIVGLWVLLVRRTASVAPPAAARVEAGAFRAALDENGVICLQMEDHYVRVHRRSGSALELSSMTDAIATHGAAGGLRVHRSWWVAADAIAGTAREGRNFRLRLHGGLSVPVARGRIAMLRERLGDRFAD
jgi:hypothetical protein